MDASSTEGAVAVLEIGPPGRVAVGGGSAFVLAGHCHLPDEPTTAVAVQVGDARQPALRFGLPRTDVYERLAEGDPARPHAYRSGFVALPQLLPGQALGERPLSVVVRGRSGREAVVRVGELGVDAGLEVPPEAGSAEFTGTGPRVAICMAAFNPPPDLLHRQLDSIRAQSHGNWVCLISDDRSDPERYESLAAAVEGDARFVLSPSPERLGFYRNFERAMSMAPAAADFVTLCDQDDSWHRDKLERLIAGIGGAQLAYSDARVVNESWSVLQTSYWTERRNNHTNFASLLMANSVTGAASLFRRELLDDVLPFPPELHEPFHDHWLAVVALALGNISYIDDPLYDYVQHGGAVIGHSQANRKPRSPRKQLLERLRNPGPGSRRAYYFNWLQQLLSARVLELRCRDRMEPGKRRSLDRLLRADSLPGLAWLMGRRARRLWGHDETLDRELFYAYAIGRARAVSMLNAGRKRPGRLLPRDASIPAPPPSRYVDGNGG